MLRIGCGLTGSVIFMIKQKLFLIIFILLFTTNYLLNIKYKTKITKHIIETVSTKKSEI